MTDLVFNKQEGMEFPLFLRKEDALNSYDRLEEANGEVSQKASRPTPVVQETSLLDIITLFQGGGFEGRPLEFYPGMEDIEKARTIMSL